MYTGPRHRKIPPVIEETRTLTWRTITATLMAFAISTLFTVGVMFVYTMLDRGIPISLASYRQIRLAELVDPNNQMSTNALWIPPFVTLTGLLMVWLGGARRGPGLGCALAAALGASITMYLGWLFAGFSITETGLYGLPLWALSYAVLGPIVRDRRWYRRSQTRAWTNQQTRSPQSKPSRVPRS